MTVYRRRLTSSFYAIEQSLERRLAYLKGRLPRHWLTDEDWSRRTSKRTSANCCRFDDDQAKDEDKVPPLFLGEIEYVEDFLGDLRPWAPTASSSN